jgi:hypothetical protein
VPAHRARAPVEYSLEDELSDAVEGVVLHGASVGTALESALRAAATTVLHRRGLRGYRVIVKTVGAGVDVQVVLPAEEPRVLSVSLGVSRR